MARRRHSPFATVRTEGAILPADLLERVAAGDRSLGGLAPTDYGLAPGESLGEAASRSWNRLLGLWRSFRTAAAALPEGEPGTGMTRERWLLPLFQELGYERLPVHRATEIDGKSYPISHLREGLPVHLVGCGVDLDARSTGVAGAARASPHSLVQEFLNRSPGHLWGFVSNGLRLRILRDNASLTRQAYVELDLEAMLDGEAFADFSLLWLLCHRTRTEAERPEDCWLERWSKAAQAEGARALDRLRDGVEGAITALGQGFLSRPANGSLREALRDGVLTTQDYYRQLLRLVYRMVFLFAAEDRELLLAPTAEPVAWERYLRHYSSRRLRDLAGRIRGTRHPDLYEAFKLLAALLGGRGDARALALTPLGSFLWSAAAVPHLDARLANRDLLEAVRLLAWRESDGRLRPVDYKNLRGEELGSVYEALLELQPELHVDGGTFALRTVGGHERKTSGSFYTPDSLVQALLDSALEPVVQARLAEAAAEAKRKGSATTYAAEAERVLLALKVCDAAVGSGHFLIAAAHRLARHLARVRTGDEEPSPEAYRAALRDVITHCLYGVDVNPMAVELCKVSLWLEAMVPGKPLGFLDAHIQCGNSLVGILDPAVLADGIPDEAYVALTSDDKDAVKQLKKRNSLGRSVLQGELFGAAATPEPQLCSADVDTLPEDTVDQVEAKRQAWERLREGYACAHQRLLADLYTAAFFAEKTKATWEQVPTNEDLRRAREGLTMRPDVASTARDLAERHGFFHWHLAFPEVFAQGGFDVLLGNPPWERVKLQEQEFFAARNPEIATAPNAAARRKLIAALAKSPEGSPEHQLRAAYEHAMHASEATSLFLLKGPRYPLTGRGDVNLYAVFAETFLCLAGLQGRAGLIVPTGIATDDGTKAFFDHLAGKGHLASVLSFENEEFIFPAVHHAYRFSLLTVRGGSGTEPPVFVFFARQPDQIENPDRRFTLSAEDIRLVNPNTRTCPVFRSQADAELTKAMYRRVPVLIEEAKGPAGNPWGIRFLAMLHMSNDSALFRTFAELQAAGGERDGADFLLPDGTRYVPLYEAKMVHQFDHRWATYEANGKDARDGSDEDKADPAWQPLPRYWVPQAEVESLLRDKGWDRGWLLGWRDICRSTDVRTVIAGVIPTVGVGDKFLLMLPRGSARLTAALLGNLDALVLDYAARQKLGGTSLKYFTMKQLAVLPPDRYSDADLAFIVPRVLELTYTAHDLAPWASDLGYRGPPFRWDPERRAQLRAELDAYYARLYGLTRDELRYILDPADVYGPDYPSETFRVLKNREMKEYGEYRTRRLVLEAWDRLVAGPQS